MSDSIDELMRQLRLAIGRGDPAYPLQITFERGQLLDLATILDSAELHLRPAPLRLTCPVCSALHVDEGDFATRPHHTHACQECGHVWRPAVFPTVGVRFLPGFKHSPNE